MDKGGHKTFPCKASAPQDEPMSYQLVGEVMAHQGSDGYRAWERDPAHWNWDTVQTPTGGCSQEYSAMHESVTERRRVVDDGLRVVNTFS